MDVANFSVCFCHQSINHPVCKLLVGTWVSSGLKKSHTLIFSKCKYLHAKIASLATAELYKILSSVKCTLTAHPKRRYHFWWQQRFFTTPTSISQCALHGNLSSYRTQIQIHKSSMAIFCPGSWLALFIISAYTWLHLLPIRTRW